MASTVEVGRIFALIWDDLAGVACVPIQARARAIVALASQATVHGDREQATIRLSACVLDLEATGTNALIADEFDEKRR